MIEVSKASSFIQIACLRLLDKGFQFNSFLSRLPSVTMSVIWNSEDHFDSINPSLTIYHLLWRLSVSSLLLYARFGFMRVSYSKQWTVELGRILQILTMKWCLWLLKKFVGFGMVKLLLGLKVICKLSRSSTFRFLITTYHQSPSSKWTLVLEQVAMVFHWFEKNFLVGENTREEDVC